MLTVAIVLGGLTAMNAQDKKDLKKVDQQKQEILQNKQDVKELSNTKSLKQESVTLKDQPVKGFQSVDNTKLPTAVQNYVKQTYQGATVTKAAMNSNGIYQLEISDAKTKAPRKVYVDKNGKAVVESLKN